MPKVTVPKAGAVGVVRDVAAHELPLQAWTDAKNIRFHNGSAQQFPGHGRVFGSPSIEPYHVLPVQVGNQSYWLYAGERKVFATTITSGVPVHTNLTRQTSGTDVNYKGRPNSWTSTLLSGIPILNPGNEVDPPQQWNLDPATRLKALDNWPADTFCKSLRAYKNFLIALNVTRNGQNLPYLIMWSSAADPGGIPVTWDKDDEDQDAGEYDLATGGDRIVDGLELRDSFMIYKEQSVWRVDFVGGQFVFGSRKVLGMSGAMNRNCIVELDGVHFVLTGSDVVVHDGQTATSVLNETAKEALFQDMDAAYNDRAFVFKNPFKSEVFVCYVAVGGMAPNKALVWNYKDRTVTYRDLPNLHHAAAGPVDNTLSDSWSSDNDGWDTDQTTWNQPGSIPNLARVLMASQDNALFLLDSSSTFDGVVPQAYLERRGLSFEDAEYTKRVSSIRPRIAGSQGETVLIKVGGHQKDPAADPEYALTMPFVIGETIQLDCMVDYRYLAIRFESGTASQWRLDSYDIEVQRGSRW